MQSITINSQITFDINTQSNRFFHEEKLLSNSFVDSLEIIWKILRSLQLANRRTAIFPSFFVIFVDVSGRGEVATIDILGHMLYKYRFHVSICLLSISSNKTEFFFK